MSDPITYPKRLIEVDLPIKRISEHARREKSIRHGHISTLHIWWARRPLAACRAVILAALWPDPADAGCPPRFLKDARAWLKRWAKDFPAKAGTETAPRLMKIRDEANLLDDPEVVRQGLLDFIADFANWYRSNDRDFLAMSRALVQSAYECLGGGPDTKPRVLDPFAGGGSIPLEALRVGAEPFASDLNPIPVLLNRLLLEHGSSRLAELQSEFRAAAETVGVRARKVLEPAFRTPGDASPIAYIWARTVTCEGPSCGVEIPTLRTLRLSTRDKDSAWLRLRTPRDRGSAIPVLEVEVVEQDQPTGTGTVKGGSVRCPVCSFTTKGDSVRAQLARRRGGSSDARLMAVLEVGPSGKKHFRAPGPTDFKAIDRGVDLLKKCDPGGSGLSVVPNEPIPTERPSPNARGLSAVTRLGMKTFGDLYTARQALVLATFAESVRIVSDAARTAGSPNADALNFLLAAAVSKRADFGSSLCSWRVGASCVRGTFARQALANTWDFGEMYPFAGSAGDWREACGYVDEFLSHLVEAKITRGSVIAASATAHPLPDDSVDAFVTDPPYYDSVPYADLSDFFFVWLHRCLRGPNALDGSESPKAEEIIWNPTRQVGGRFKDKLFYEEGMTSALREGRRVTTPGGIAVVVFAHKSTAGWEAILEALLKAGWIATGSWPLDTERSGRTNAVGTASLESSIHLVCRPRENPDGSLRTDAVGDWRDVLSELPKRIHEWMPRLVKEGIVGADAIFACLGPALEVFSRYSRVEKASGEAVALKEYLEHVWAAVAKEALAAIFSGAETAGFEEDARLTAMWLWTVAGGDGEMVDDGGDSPSDDEEVGDADDESDDEGSAASKGKSTKGFALEYDAARKIAQGLGAHLEALESLVEVKKGKARLLSVGERARALFSEAKDEETTVAGKAKAAKTRAKKKQLTIGGFMDDVIEAEERAGPGGKLVARPAATVLDRVHQAMILFGAGRGEALRRFLVDDGVGKDERFWRLAQALNQLYPSGTDERRWVEGVMARKKGLGL